MKPYICVYIPRNLLASICDTQIFNCHSLELNKLHIIEVHYGERECKYSIKEVHHMAYMGHDYDKRHSQNDE